MHNELIIPVLWGVGAAFERSREITLGDAQGLLLALHSAITPNGALGTTWNARDGAQVGAYKAKARPNIITPGGLTAHHAQHSVLLKGGTQETISISCYSCKALIKAKLFFPLVSHL